MARCNHFSCLDCWVLWLHRSGSCPTCRQPTQKEQLSVVIFEREAGEGAPSLTQMCQSDQEDDTDGSGDDEEQLEIVQNYNTSK